MRGEWMRLWDLPPRKAKESEGEVIYEMMGIDYSRYVYVVSGGAE